MTSLPYLRKALCLKPLSFQNEQRLMCNGQFHVIRYVVGVASRSSRGSSRISIAEGFNETEETLQCMIEECNETFAKWSPLPRLHILLGKVSKSKIGTSICFNKVDMIPGERQFISLVEAAKRGDAALVECSKKVHRVVREAYDLYAQDIKALESGVTVAAEVITVEPDDDTKSQQLLAQVIRLTNQIADIIEKKDKAVAENLDDLRKGNDRQHISTTGFNQNLGKILDKLPSPGYCSSSMGESSFHPCLLPWPSGSLSHMSRS